MRLAHFAQSALAFCALAPAAAVAQSTKSVDLGVQAGATFSKPGGEDATDVNSTLTGFAVGGFARLGVGKSFAIQPELLYVRKGAKQDDGGATTTVRIGYIEVPVLAMLRIRPSGGGSITPRLYAGPALGIKIGCSVKGSQSGTSITASCENADVHVKSTDLGLMFGAGIDVGHAVIDIRYDLGLTKVDDDPDPADVKNRTIFLLVGWKFRSH